MITAVEIDPRRREEYYAKGFWTSSTLLDVWKKRLEDSPATEYVSDSSGLRLTYAEVDEKASRLASWLVENGVEPGDIVSFQTPAWADFCIIYVAVLKAGGVMHPLAKNFNDEDLTFIMNTVESKAFICPTTYHGTDYERQILNARERIPSLGPIALLDKESPAKSDLPAISEIIAGHSPLDADIRVSSDDVACILSTSGTTGKPKQVLLTHNNILFSERSFTSDLGLDERSVMWMASPLNHATGFFHGLISPLLLGGRSVLQDRFNAEDAIELVKREGATWSMGATPFIHDLLETLEETGGRLDTLKLFLCGGAPVPSSLIEQANEHGILLCEIYGSTESCPHIHVPPEKCLEWNGAWSGIPYEGIEVRVVDDRHRAVACGVQGEECSRGPHQFVGYLNDERRTRMVLDHDGWFYSGDLCFMDEEGRVRINGRKKEIIIRGGENISAVEIDEDLTGCPGIGDHATIGMPDKRLGERICTFAVPTSNTRPSVTDIQSYLADKHIQKRLWPEHLEYIDEIPHTATGKVKRNELSDELKHRLASIAPQSIENRQSTPAESRTAEKAST